MDEFDYEIKPPDTETRSDLYKALRGMITGKEFVNPYRFGSTSFDQNPKKFIDRSSPDYQESIFAEPSELPQLDTGGIAGQIRGLPDKLAKVVRKAMQNELKARGPNPFEASTLSANQRDWKEYGGVLNRTLEQDEANVTSRLLRGTWYRGQSEYPSQARLEPVIDPTSGKEVSEYVTKQFGKEYSTEAPTFAGLRTKDSNIGEPHGISMSYDPHVSAGFRAPPTIDEATKDEIINKVGQGLLPDNVTMRAARLADTNKVARVMPLYGEAPEGKILQAWKPEHGAEFRQAYLESAKEMAEKYPAFRESIEGLGPGASGEEIKNAIQNASNLFEYDSKTAKIGSLLKQANDPKYTAPRDELNSLMSKKLMERGWKGMLHSPHRYQEYELRMFDPYNVMYIDKRAVNTSKYSNNPMSSKAVRRLDEMKSALKREHETVTEGKPKTLADWYRDITREEILGLPKFENHPDVQAIREAHMDILHTKLPEDVAQFIDSGWASGGPQKYYQSVKDIYGTGPLAKYYETWGQKYFEEIDKVANKIKAGNIEEATNFSEAAAMFQHNLKTGKMDKFKKPDLSHMTGETGHGDMADKVAPTAAMLEWGKKNKIKQEAYMDQFGISDKTKVTLKKIKLGSDWTD